MKMVASLVSFVVFGVTAVIIGVVSRQVAWLDSISIDMAAIIITSYYLMWGIVLYLQ